VGVNDSPDHTRPNFLERTAAVSKQHTISDQCFLQPGNRNVPRRRESTNQSIDGNSVHKIIGLFTALQGQLFNRHTTMLSVSGVAPCSGTAQGLSDVLGVADACSTVRLDQRQNG